MVSHGEHASYELGFSYQLFQPAGLFFVIVQLINGRRSMLVHPKTHLCLLDSAANLPRLKVGHMTDTCQHTTSGDYFCCSLCLAFTFICVQDFESGWCFQPQDGRERAETAPGTVIPE